MERSEDDNSTYDVWWYELHYPVVDFVTHLYCYCIVLSQVDVISCLLCLYLYYCYLALWELYCVCVMLLQLGTMWIVYPYGWHGHATCPLSVTRTMPSVPLSWEISHHCRKLANICVSLFFPTSFSLFYFLSVSFSLSLSHSLVGLVVKASTSREAGLGFDSR